MMNRQLVDLNTVGDMLVNDFQGFTLVYFGEAKCIMN